MTKQLVDAAKLLIKASDLFEERCWQYQRVAHRTLGSSRQTAYAKLDDAAEKLRAARDAVKAAIKTEQR